MTLEEILGDILHAFYHSPFFVNEREEFTTFEEYLDSLKLSEFFNLLREYAE